MKKVLLIAIALFWYFSINAQYTASPWNGTGAVSGCPTSNDFCVTTTLASTVQLVGVFNGSNFRIAIAKCPVSNFTTSGTFYLKTGSICGTQIGQVTVTAGTNSSYIDVPLSSITSTTSFYGIFQTGATRYHTLGITLYPPPDLYLTNVSINPTSVQSGSNLIMTHTVRNNGQSDAAPFRISYYLSTNTTLDASDQLLNYSDYVSGLSASSQYTSATQIINIPASTTAGSYYLIAFIDSDNVVSESSESNNKNATFVTITNPPVAPDLRIELSSLSSTSVQKGSVVTANYAFYNSGGAAGAFSNRFVLSTNTTYSTDDIVLYTSSVGSYAANSSDLGLTQSLTIPTTVTPGNYYVVAYADYANQIAESNETNNGSFSFLTVTGDPTCPTASCITGQTVANFVQTGNDGFCAAQYLCNNNIIIAAQPSPTANLTRGDLANIAYRGLVGQNNNTNAINFPCPFPDLQVDDASTTEYYKHAKTLCYLDYGDGRSPFKRDSSINFNPSLPITKALVLKVLLESWNIDESTASGSSPYLDIQITHPYYNYIKKAHELGIVVGSGINFSDVDCTREIAFLMLYRLLTNVSIPKPTLTQVNAGLFIPGQYRPDNLGIGVGTDRGNFNHYTKTSFAMDGVVPLIFAHSYNSYTTELPNQIYPNYLGRGWTHSFNCYITVIGTAPNLKLVVHYPDGKLHFYKTQGGIFVPETIGVFDQVTTSGSPINSVTITTPSKIVYVFEVVVGQTNNFYWLIKSIKDRNNNTLSFTNEIGISGVPRVASVADQAGRSLTFTYLTGQNYNYLSQVTLAGVGASFNGRNIQFTYHPPVLDGDGIRDLATYKEYDLLGALKTTSYAYYNTEGSEHLLKTITLPKLNVIDNTYEKRKLRSSQTLDVTNSVVQQMNTNWTPTYNSTSQGSTGSVSVTTSSVTKTTNYNHNSNGLAQTINSTGTNPVNLSMTYGVIADPTSVSQITQMAGSTPTNVTIDYQTVAPYNVSSVTTAGPSGNIVQSYTYNSFNDIVNFTNGRGNITTFGYNGTGNLTSITHPLGQPTAMLRNTNGTIQRVTTPAGIATNFTYNTYGNLLTTSTPNGSSAAITTSAAYDALSRVISKTDARNQTVTYDYFANDLLKKMNAPLSYYVEYNYDANDNNTTVTNAKGNATTNVYNTQTDQLTSRSFGAKTESFTYYEDGSLKTFTNGRNQVFTFTYDPSGRITDDSYSAYTYNPEGTLNTVTHTQGTKTYTLDYDYDVLRRLNKTTCDGFAVQYRYDNNNNLDLLTYPDGKTIAYAYDNKDRLSTVTDWAGRVTTYVYDDDGKILSYTLPNGSKAIYSYDAAGRPTGISHQKSTNVVICSSSFVLDQGGNHLEENIIEPYTTAPALTAGTTNYTTNARNETTQVGSATNTFDGNGATTNQAGQTLTWDTKDNLLTAYTKTFFYDGNETRRAKTGKRYVINELSNSVIAETNDAGTYLYYYVYGPTGLLYRQNASTSAVEYYHYDFRGSTIAMTDASQNTVRQYQYDAYGKILQQTPAVASDDNPFRYVGQQGVQYEEPNLYFMRARYYDPTTGKFLSEDPIWGTNLFAYGNDNPVMMIDASGLSSTYSSENSTATLASANGSAYSFTDKNNGTQVGIVNGATSITTDSKGLSVNLNYSAISVEKTVYQDQNTTVKVGGSLVNANVSISTSNPTLDVSASLAQGTVTTCRTVEKLNIDVEVTTTIDIGKVDLTGFKPVAVGGDIKITPGANTSCKNPQYNYGKGNSCDEKKGYKPNGQTVFSESKKNRPKTPSYGPGDVQ